MENVDIINAQNSKIAKRKLSYSMIAIFVIIISSLSIMFGLKDYEVPHKIIYFDVLQYYSYLPATFIEEDYTMSFMIDENGNYRELEYGKKYWPHDIGNGRFIFKTSMGVAICYSPFFFIANALVPLFGNFEADGFSPPYALSLMISCIAFLLLGLIFLRKLLLKYFSDIATAITLVVIVMTTNMFWYVWSFEAPESHIYSFSFIAVFLYYTDKWFEKQNWKNTIWIGLSFGMISLIRPSNALIAIVFVLYGVNSFETFKQRIMFFLRNYKYIVVIILATFIVWLPQLTYWKAMTGKFLFYSYGEDERFFFDNPFIFEGLIGFRAGWLIYSPIMIFSMIGLYFLNKKKKGFLLPISVFFILNVYVIFSWWCWWYGGAFGCRPLVDCYALLALPLAAFIEWTLKSKRKIKVPILIIFTIIALQSAFHILQHYCRTLHHNSMTKEAYIDSFWRLKKTDKFDSLLGWPDYDEARKGNR